MFGRKRAPERNPEDIQRALVAVAAAGSEAEFLASVREQAARLVEADSAAVFLYEPTYRELHGRSLAGKDIRFALGQGAVGGSAQKGEAWMSAKPAEEEPYSAAIDGLPGGAAPASLLAVPMADEDGALRGAVEVSGALSGSFSEADASALQSFAGSAVALLESCRRSGEWRGLVFSLAEAFGRTVDAKAAATVNHCTRVRDLALALGRSMGLTGPELEGLELAALLHDVGRLETAASEFSEEAHRIHIFFTEAFMRSLRLPGRLAEAVDIACQHHENFDGSGYPRGLRGEQMPQAARVLQVVNAYDALVFTPQAGGRPLTESDALGRLRAEAGKLFDPAAVEAFISRKLYVQEKRQYARLERLTPVDVTPILPDGHEGQSFEATAQDLSSGGMLLEVPEDLPVGTLLRAVIHLPGERIESLAKVVRRLPPENDKFRAGVLFLWQSSSP